MTVRVFPTGQGTYGTIHKVAGIVVRNRKLLLTRKRGTGIFISPGGKSVPGETPEDTLQRELAEETGLTAFHFDFFGRFEGASALEQAKVVMDVYRVATGGAPAARSEISELLWIGGDHDRLGVKIGSIFRDYVIPDLVAKGVIDANSYCPEFSPGLHASSCSYIVVDLDGSIIFNNSALAAPIAASVRELCQTSRKVVFATSRAPRGVRRVLPNDLWELPTIFCNGALVQTGEGSQLRRPILAEIAAEVSERLLRKKASFQLEYGSSFDLFGEKRRFPHQLKYSCYRHNPELTNGIFDDVLKIVTPDCEALYELLRACPSLLSRVELLYHESGFAELLASGVNKATAVKRLVNDGAAHVIALINDYNDFDLLTACSSATIVGRRLWAGRRLSRTRLIRPNASDISKEILRLCSESRAVA